MNYNNQIPNPTLKTKWERRQTQIDNRSRKKNMHGTHGKSNEQLFPKQVVIHLP